MAVQTDHRLDWVLAACGRILQPVVKLALAMGLQYADLDVLLRDLLLKEARRSWLAKGIEPNISQLSVTTGLNRKAITAKIREPEDALPRTESSAAAKTTTLWLEMINDHPEHALLPVVADDQTLCFESLAKQASRGNVHHRTILEELVRLDMAIEREGHVALTAKSFVPTASLKAMLAFLGDNVRDHLLAGVANTLGQQPKMLERAVFAKGLTLEDARRIHSLVRDRWSVLHGELATEMRKAVDGDEGAESSRMRVGIYAYYEDTGSGTADSEQGKNNSLVS